MLDWALGGVVVLIIAGALFTLVWWLRLRWLHGLSGRFDCALKLGRSEEAWALGVGRYFGERLQWYRSFSLNFRPQHTWARTSVIVTDSRRPSMVEASALYDDQQIITLQARGSAAVEDSWQVAVPQASVTGLLSWLEAAPPGEGHYRLVGGVESGSLPQAGSEGSRPESRPEARGPESV